jgi:hypothetical protein
MSRALHHTAFLYYLNTDPDTVVQAGHSECVHMLARLVITRFRCPGAKSAGGPKVSCLGDSRVNSYSARQQLPKYWLSLTIWVSYHG